MHIGAHDEAYDWARTKRFQVHEATGVFQVFDEARIESVVQETQPAQSAPVVASYPLSALSEDELFAAGVPRPLVPAVISVQSDEALEALSEYLPADCRDVLYGLAAGMTLDDALREMLGTTQQEAAAMAPAGGGDFTKLTQTPNFDLVLVEGQEELKRILEGSLEEWRIFLHPYQRKLVRWETQGPMNLTGAAGTGKTVALMHRAVHLAGRLADPKARILFTTFTTNLSVTIKHLIQGLSPECAERIEVTNLHALARTICSRSGWKGRIGDDDELDQVWEEVWLDPSLGALPMERSELKREYELVIDPNGIDDEDAYLCTVRSDRPRISRAQRRAAWPVFRAFKRGLKKPNLLTFEGAVHEARLAAEQGNFHRYAHVLVPV